MDELIAASNGRPGARQLDGVATLGVRMLAGDTAAHQAVLDSGLPWVNMPSELAGTDPFVAWRAPEERLVLGRHVEPMQRLLRALAPGLHTTALAVDLSESVAVIELHGAGLDDWLAHLVDASAIPRAPGRASRSRLADVPALLLRLSGERLWLTVERPLLPYVIDWLAYAHEGAFASTP